MSVEKSCTKYPDSVSKHMSVMDQNYFVSQCDFHGNKFTNFAVSGEEVGGSNNSGAIRMLQCQWPTGVSGHGYGRRNP